MNKHSASDKYLLSAAFESCLLPDYSKHNELQLVFDGSPSFESSEIFACKTVVLPSDKYMYKWKNTTCLWFIKYQEKL